MKKKIIIINGPCGIGKSTVAQKIHDDIPLSFLLDIDAQRRFISGRREKPEESGPMAMAISQNILKTCLQLGVDIVIDKMTFDKDVLDSFYKIADKYDAEIYEIILFASKELVTKRSEERGYSSEDGAGLFTAEKCEYFWEEINKIKDVREKAHIINVEELSEDDVHSEIKRIVSPPLPM